MAHVVIVIRIRRLRVISSVAGKYLINLQQYLHAGFAMLIYTRGITGQAIYSMCSDWPSYWQLDFTHNSSLVSRHISARNWPPIHDL